MFLSSPSVQSGRTLDTRLAILSVENNIIFTLLQPKRMMKAKMGGEKKSKTSEVRDFVNILTYILTGVLEQASTQKPPSNLSSGYLFLTQELFYCSVKKNKAQESAAGAAYKLGSQ